MKTEFRNRAFLPLVIPLGVVLTIAAVIAGFAFILLHVSRELAVVLAILMAAGILTSVALAASQDELDAPRRLAVGAAGITPVVLGLLIALGLGGIPTEELNINREPHAVIPEDAPVILAYNAQDFAFNGGPAEEPGPGPVVRLPADQETTVVFDHRDDGVPHDWTMLTEEDGEVIVGTATEEGPAELTALVPPQEAGEYYFLCTVHPNMNGTVEVSEDVTEASVEAGR